MIREDFIVQQPAGFYCRYGDFYLDPKQAVKNAVISHAHADHAAPGSLNVYTSTETFAFMQFRYKKQAAKFYTEVEFGKPFRINGVEICFLPAGHMLGSAQVWMSYEGASYLYTGDIKLGEDSTCTPAAFRKADVLIIESTFAKKDFRHPDVAGELARLSQHGASTIVMGCYVLGKAQRMTALINRYCAEKKVVVHPSVIPFHQIYERFGMRLGSYEAVNKKELRGQHNLVYLVPPLTCQTFRQRNEYKTVFVSGWDKLQHSESFSMMVSDHADWGELLHIIEQVKPSQVWTVHGDGTDIDMHFKGSDIQIRTLV